MSEKSESENLGNNNSGNNFSIESLGQDSSLIAQDNIQIEKKDKFSWQFGENVKRDSFGFILRTDPLPLNTEKTKKSDNHDNLNNIDSERCKIDKKNDKRKSEDRYDEGKKDRERGRDRDRDRDRDKPRDRDRSPHGYKRK